MQQKEVKKEVAQALDQIKENKEYALDLFSDMLIERHLNTETIVRTEIREKDALILKSIRDLILYS